MKTLVRNNLPYSLVKLLRKLLSRKNPKYRKYDLITLTDEDIKQATYKRYVGGKDTSWKSRGAFQLFFLQEMGMHQNSKVLDVGCGPGRASKHLIAFLADNNYYGLDYNADFIRAACAMSEKENLAVKHPSFKVVQNFNLVHNESIFDYAIAFSVLNHCDVEQKEAFFKRIPIVMKTGSKVYISHARWFDESFIKKTRMKLIKLFGSDDYNIIKFGWNNKDEIFPVIELEKY